MNELMLYLYAVGALAWAMFGASYEAAGFKPWQRALAGLILGLLGPFLPFALLVAAWIVGGSRGR